MTSSRKASTSKHYPDMRRLMDAQAQVVGKWGDTGRVPEAQRLTWFYPDFGSYVVKEFVSPERLAECARGVELQQEAAGRKRARQEKAPIAAQLREAGKLAGERQAPAAPKRNAPDRGDRYICSCNSRSNSLSRFSIHVYHCIYRNIRIYSSNFQTSPVAITYFVC